MHKTIQAVSLNNKNSIAFEKGVAPQLIYEYVNDAIPQADLHPYRLVESSKPAPHLAPLLQPLLAANLGTVGIVTHGEKMHTPTGTITAGDLVGLCQNPYNIQVARVLCLACANDAFNVDPKCFICVEVAKQHGDRAWTIDARQAPIWLNIGYVVKALIYLYEQDNVFEPFLPFRGTDSSDWA